ncbi:hypothetical protein [Kitasatospora griseola]|uniref:hypothetical protein n=1 Tax=Kitasatospora griseola TaxID=2064 RepID=UPI00341EBA9A
MIEKAWGRPIADLEEAAGRLPVEDPLLHAVMRARHQLVVVHNAATALQHRLHALTRPGYVPALHELDRLASTASTLRAVHAEGHAAVQAIHNLINAHEFALKGVGGPNSERVRAADTRSAPTRAPGLAAGRLAPPPSAVEPLPPLPNRR